MHLRRHHPAHMSVDVATDREVATLGVEQLVALVHQQATHIAQLRHQLDWFRRQLFGAKSERWPQDIDPSQLSLMAQLGENPPPAAAIPRTIPAHTRRSTRRDTSEGDNGALFFDPAKVPVQTIVLPAPDTEGLSPEQYTVIGEKVSYRLAQRPSSHVVLKYVRPVIKRKDAAAPTCAPAPSGVIEGSRADVSFIAGLMIDKFLWHQPLHRQHQRLEQRGFRTTRPWLTQLAHQGIELLRPIEAAQRDSIRQSHVLAMDETPIKAGVAKGQMKRGYFWPVYGDRDEVCFPYGHGRAHANVPTLLGNSLREDVVLLSDGYPAYAAYSKKMGVTLAQCWAHTRRYFFDARQSDPRGADEALARIGALYAIEEVIRNKKLAGEDRRHYRATHSRPEVAAFFEWVEGQLRRSDLVPSLPFAKALAYARERRAALEVFLVDPDVAIDTNYLERALRVIPMGRKNWMFCWTELGAEHVGIVQSLLVTCRLHGIDPYTYLVDVLQRVAQHPASRVDELTPRRWKACFADDPLRSDLDRYTPGG